MHLQQGTKAVAAPLRATAFVIGMACAGLACADDDAPAPAWSLRGFGSAGVAYSGHAGADYTSSILKANGVGRSSRWSSALDSRLGAQLTARVDHGWSAVLQVIAEQRLDHRYKPVVEWAYLKYQASPELSLRFGRIALPLFLAADYRQAGYTYPWARTPVEVYGALTLTNNDGVDATYRWHRNGFKNVTQVFFGHTVMRTPTARLEGRQLAGVSNTVESGAASARISVMSTSLSADAGKPLFDALRQFGPQGGALVDRFALERKRTTAVSIGASYDPGGWFAMGELGTLRSRSFVGVTTSLYTSAGYRFGDFTPYVAYARVRAKSATTDRGLDLAGMPPAAAGQGAMLNGFLNELLATIPIQRTVSVGARWDFATDLALKLQLDRVAPTGSSNGTFLRVQPGLHAGHTVDVASAVLDFVF
ncbi:MAG: porin [Pseudomonadota bacterium]